MATYELSSSSIINRGKKKKEIKSLPMAAEWSHQSVEQMNAFSPFTSLPAQSKQIID
jgi:hypothetical protein